MKKNNILALMLTSALIASSIGCTQNIIVTPDEKKEEVNKKEEPKDGEGQNNPENNPGNTPGENGDNNDNTPGVEPEIPVNPIPVPAGLKGLRAAPGIEEIKSGQRTYFNYNSGSDMNLFHDYAVGVPPVTFDNNGAAFRQMLLQSNREGVTISRTRNANRDDFLYSEQFVFDRKSDQIFLGNVLQGRSVSDGSFVPLAGVITQPITISTALVSTGNPIHSQIIMPKLSQYRDVVNGWMSNDFKPSAARTSTEIRDIKISEESGTNSGFNIDGLSEYLQSIGFKLEIARIKRRTNILVKFIQSAYSVAMDRPNGCLVMDYDLQAYMKDRSRPLYISNIEYGRAYYIMISSNYSSDEVKAAFNLSGKGATEGSMWRAFSESYYKKIRDEAIVNASMVGGTSFDHGVLIAQGWEAFKQSLANQFPLTAAEPIAIGLNFVDNNAPAQVHYTGTANTKESIFIPKCKELRVKMNASGIRATAGFKGIGKVRVYGKGYISVPGRGRQQFLNIPQSSYLNLEKGMDEFVVPSGRLDFTKAIEIKIPMFGSSHSMERRLNQEVTIDLELNHSGAYGSGHEGLGKLQVKMTLAEFLFYCQDGGFTISTRENRLIDFQGEIRIQLEPFTVIS